MMPRNALQSGVERRQINRGRFFAFHLATQNDYSLGAYFYRVKIPDHIQRQRPRRWIGQFMHMQSDNFSMPFLIEFHRLINS
jgi:hypothetical protein